MSDIGANTNSGTEITPNTDSNSNHDVATAVLDKKEKTEETFTPGELKWTADKAKEEPSSTISEAFTTNPTPEVATPEVATTEAAMPDVNRKRWIWAASLTGIFLTSFLMGYTVLGGQYWREVFDIHTWIHMIKLLFG